ncbi:hypothetical protein [Nocardioides pantholopis]|uniref:hypothetical protein n=1 Tax=Nocardioides pantholopis TaxID=2483798 RepID=UPI000F08BA2D|nr:hypothetical protein [Nocardioides pantholopis]
MGVDIETPRGSEGLQRQSRRSARGILRTAIAAWVGANVAVALTAPDDLPFDWPARADSAPWELLLETNLALIQVLLMIGVVYWLTRRRPDPRVLDRAPERTRALRETVGLLAYGALGLLGGFVLARAFGWHPFGLHLAGSLVGTHEHVARAEVLAWAGYNLVVYAVVPLLYFRRRYSPTALGLRSTAPRNDLLVIGVVLVLETWFQVVVGRPDLFELPAGQLLRGASLTFALYFVGTVLPAMVFVYAILIPRFLRLTGSATATVLYGGLTYAGLHLWDAWTSFDSPGSAALSVVFVVFTYLGPGMVKSFLTLRTGNAWVHVWAYHAFSPHTLIDTPHIVEVFRVR